MNTQQILPRKKAGRVPKVIGFVVLGVVLLLLFEEIVNLIALNLFPHHDSASCAGADTFCSPDGAGVITGGTLVFIVANLLLAGVVIGVLVARRRRARLA